MICFSSPSTLISFLPIDQSSMDGSKNYIQKILCPINLGSNTASGNATDPQTSTPQQHPPMSTPTLKDIICPRSNNPSKDPNASTSAPKGTPLPTIQKVFARRTGGTKWPRFVHMQLASSSRYVLAVFPFLSFCSFFPFTRYLISICYKHHYECYRAECSFMFLCILVMLV